MNVAEELFRFAELAARTGLEPELGERFDGDPVAVLTEFELPVGDMAWAGEHTLFIDDLSPRGDGFDGGWWGDPRFCISIRSDLDARPDASTGTGTRDHLGLRVAA
ncbi:hypothetical protein ACFRJ1_29665 [Streptomyces sp. NPDC056773]|uniref:hypothetical protein n=1 Tax=unclassified Streptomyces TaxID=2593676 RepID=UPI003676B718